MTEFTRDDVIPLITSYVAKDAYRLLMLPIINLMS